jgi:hypothetical protein
MEATAIRERFLRKTSRKTVLSDVEPETPSEIRGSHTGTVAVCRLDVYRLSVAGA